MPNLGQSTSYGNEKLKKKWTSFSTPGTYTWQVPAGVYWIKAILVGGGGGGGGGSSAYGGGGGGGGQIWYIIANATPGESVSITVGAGGSGGTGGSSPTAGGNGGSSQIQFSDGSYAIATAGGGGRAGTSSAGGSGGSGGGGTWLTMQNGREIFPIIQNGNSGSAGSSSGGGPGGPPNYPNADLTGFLSSFGEIYGNGGGGGGLNANGYAGLNGIVFIWWEE